MSELKIRPLEKIRIGGTGTLTALTSCNNEILRNLESFGQDLCHIWRLQCIVMEDLVDGLYKKTLKPTKIALRISSSLTIDSMLADREVQELLREFEQRGLQNLMSTPPASAPCEETPPALTQPMQTRSTRKKFKPEVRSKRNEDRHKPSGKTLEDPEMYPPGSVEWRHVVCLMQKYIGMQSQEPRLLRTQSFGWSNVR